MPDPQGIVPFKQFLAAVQDAKHAEFTASPRAKVAHEGSFAEMKSHVLKLYNGIQVPHSFVDENGSIFDCVPIEQQPSLRGSRGAVPAAPDMPRAEQVAAAADERTDRLVQPQLSQNKRDRHGNVMYCPSGTIPMRRVTLEDLTQFEDLKHFFRKAPNGGVEPPRAPNPAANPQAVAATHRWAHAFQNVNNVGGHSFLNV